MDFAQILEEWERGKSKSHSNYPNGDTADKCKQTLERWIDSEKNWKYYDKGPSEEYIDPIAAREHLRKLEPEDEIDLHGLNLEQSLTRLEQFLNEAVQRGLRKVQIVHGKGNHSKGKAVLPKAVLEYLQQSPIAGELGTPRREKGGAGATWVIIKTRD
ncbi:MAG: Smr/MutS family protein [Spirochaetia bacterium]|nr:Smr/MutS family protein [Spirochaetia bacterium]